MMKFAYIADCKAGCVKFTTASGESVVMPKGVPVEVPDWLAGKLANNNHFERRDGLDVRDVGAVPDARVMAEL